MASWLTSAQKHRLLSATIVWRVPTQDGSKPAQLDLEDEHFAALADMWNRTDVLTTLGANPGAFNVDRKNGGR
jgi:hypothetical protein